MRQILLITSTMLMLSTLIAAPNTTKFKPALFKLSHVVHQHKQPVRRTPCENSPASAPSTITDLEPCQQQPVIKKNDRKRKRNNTSDLQVSLAVYFSDGRYVNSAMEYAQAGVSIQPNTQIVVGASIINPNAFKYVALDIQSEHPLVSKIYPAVQVGASEINNSKINQKGLLIGGSLRYRINEKISAEANHKIINSTFEANHQRTHLSSIGIVITK